jgi:hypothetical protein
MDTFNLLDSIIGVFDGNIYDLTNIIRLELSDNVIISRHL